ncbi:MAG: cysteine desulfurase family protein [Roseibacillus sp.]|jgi:cysteine desulfurase|nr:cysteine desulfurase family protein [Roseibacillus sp.]
MIYLDSNATSQVHPEVVEAMLPFLTDHWYNPSSGYRAAKAVKQAITESREKVAALINAHPDEIVFTGCGTESNNMTLKWLARLVGRKESKIVTSATEHSAVLRPCEAMAEVGYEVALCGVEGDGRLRVDEFAELVDGERPGFASVMWSNNETGVINPMEEVCRIAKEAGWAFHTDAIQAVGKMPVDVRAVPVDFLSLSGHKFHAPKGVGALYAREGVRFEPMIRGGGQEDGRRSGTENVASIVALGTAAEIMRQALEGDGHAEVKRRRDRFEERLLSEIEGVTLNGSRDHRAGNIVHASFEHCEAAGLLILLDEAGVQCSAGSACMTGKQQPSHVQKAMGLSDERARSSLRISLSIFTTDEEVETAASAVARAVEKLRRVQGPPGVGPVMVYGG